MDKKDLLYVVAALGIILIVAVVVKPIMTGHPVNTGIAEPVTTIPTPAAVSGYDPALGGPLPTTPAAATVPTTVPVPTPTRNLSTQAIGFVDPSTYHISSDDQTLHATRIDSVPVNNSLSTIATISGRYSGTTQIIQIPYPYWELWYTAEPSGETGGQKQKLSSSTYTGPEVNGVPGPGSSNTVIQGSFSATFPTLSIQIMDANDPNRIVRTIEPPGGIDTSLWSSTTDPRPWSEKFFEGQRSYFFIINAHELDSYSLQIKVPSSYLGKY